MHEFNFTMTSLSLHQLSHIKFAIRNLVGVPFKQKLYVELRKKIYPRESTAQVYCIEMIVKTVKINTFVYSIHTLLL